jgi:hypothetical protein
MAGTAARALLAAGTYVAQDMRDPDGMMRPVLRRLAFRLAASPRPALRSLGTRYLHGDRAVPGETLVLAPSTAYRVASDDGLSNAVIDLDPMAVVEVDGAAG